MREREQWLSVVVGICVICLMAIPALAQQGYGTQEEQMQGTEVTDEMLESAAEAYVEIRRINEEFERSVQQTEEQAERRELQNAANQKMIQAVEENGLEVTTYNNIMKQVRTDQMISQRFEQLMESIQ